MTETYSFPPYVEVVGGLLDKFGGTKLETYNGVDITPLWDLKGKGLSSSFKYVYSAPKLEKIIFAEQSYRDKLMTYTALIWPDDQHALPIFSSFWAESAKGSYFIADFYPTADCICDTGYMEKYLEPLDSVYSTGLKLFPERSSRDPDWFRALSSPYYSTADFGPSTAETQKQLMDLTVDYLKIYHKLWEKDEPRDPAYMQRLIERRQAIRKNLKEKDPGGLMLENSVGHEMAELTLTALF